MARVKIAVHGTKSLEKAFLELAEKVGNEESERVLEESLMEAAEPVRVHAQTLVRKKSGKTAKLIGLSRRLEPDQTPTAFTQLGFAQVFLGLPTRSLGVIIEFGTVQRFWTGAAARRRAKRLGQPARQVAPKSTGVMPAFPFMRPAWEAGKRGIVARFAPLLWSRVDKLGTEIGQKQMRTVGR